MMKSCIYLVALLFLCTIDSFSENLIDNSTTSKKGLNFNLLPIFGYDNDKGTEYGAIIDIFDFGDGSKYPIPNQELYLEYTAFTGGTQQYYITYDNRSLIPGLQFTINPFYRYESNMNFYGYNGYQTKYITNAPSFNNGALSYEGLSSFYQVQHKNYGCRIDLKKNIWKSIFLQGSYIFNYTETDNVNTKNINKGNYSSNTPVSGYSLLEYYKKWGIIPNSDGIGGVVSATNLSLVWDSRDANAVPKKGIWAEARLTLAPKLLGTKKSYYKYNITYRQYLPVIKNLIFAYRLDYSATIGNYQPYYRLPIRVAFGNVQDFDGIGGNKTVRGINRDRVVGLDNIFFNTSFRYFLPDFALYNQKIGFCINGFFDGGMVTRGYDLTYHNTYNNNELLTKYNEYIDLSIKDSFHFAYGFGLKLILNDNFVVSMDYGIPLNSVDDGSGGMYICTGFLF